MLKVNWFITDQNVTVNYNGQTHIVKRTDALATNLINAIKEGRLDDVPNLVSVAQAMEHKSKGDVVVRDGELFVKGVRVPTELARKIQQFIDEGLPYQPLVKFAENLQGNPSFRAVNELFQFLEKNNHPLTENGNFIAYKRVRADFKDIYSGTFDNTPGLPPVEVPRNQVDEDPNRTCSRGLHVANWSYAHTQFASHNPTTDVMLEVEVNPADVVAVPTDYDQAKMRVCKYKVLGVTQTEYKDSGLRLTDPNYSFVDASSSTASEEVCTKQPDFEEDEDEDEEEVEFCEECGAEVEPGYCLCEDCDYDYCDECGYYSCECDEEHDECSECGEEECVCDDEYPWDDELKG